MRRAIAALALVATLLAAGCLGYGVGPSSNVDPATDETETTQTTTTRERASNESFYVYTNHEDHSMRVTVYVVDGRVEAYAYVLPNGSTVTAAPWRNPERRPDDYTDVRPANEVFWSGTYVVDPEASLILEFRNVPKNATLMDLEVPNSTPVGGVLVEHGGGHTSERCRISIAAENGSRSMGGCGYDYEEYVVEGATRNVTVTLNASGT